MFETMEPKSPNKIHYEDEDTKITKEGDKLKVVTEGTEITKEGGKWTVKDGGPEESQERKPVTKDTKILTREGKPSISADSAEELKEALAKEKMEKGKKLKEWASGYGGEYQGPETGAFGEEPDKETLKVQQEIKKAKDSLEKAEIPQTKLKGEEILKEAGLEQDVKPVDVAKKEEEFIENQAVRKEVLDKLWERVGETSPGSKAKFTEKVSALNKRENIFLSVLKAGKKLAIRGGEILLAAGLSPFAALEIIGQEAVGRFQMATGERKKTSAEAKIGEIEKTMSERKFGPNMEQYYTENLNHLRKTSEKSSDMMKSGYTTIRKKGFLLKTFEKLFFNRKEEDIEKTKVWIK